MYLKWEIRIEIGDEHQFVIHLRFVSFIGKNYRICT